MTRKLSFFDFWRSKKEREALLERTNQLRLLPSQLKGLLGDSGVRATLQNGRLASLLPPVGTEVFRRFSPASLEEIQQRHEPKGKEPEKKKKKNKKNKELAEKDLPKPSSDLEAGKPLPFIYGDPPPELLNTPLEELDPYYQSQKTFIVLGKGNIIHRFNAESACYLLSPFNPLRTVAIKILLHSLFRWFILATILTNCVVMTLSAPPMWINAVEYVFIAIYTFEVIIKILSRGFCIGKFTFLRDPFNWLDVIVIITAYSSIFVILWKCLNAVRVLKIITVIQGLKTTVISLVRSLKRLAGVIVVMVFCLSILAMISVQVFLGNLKQKCIIKPHSFLSNQTVTSSYYHYEETGSSDFNFQEYLSNTTNYYYMPYNLDALLCGNRSDAGVCPEGYVCIKGGKNPNYGYTNFDSFGWSLLSMLRLLTGDFWENLMQLCLRSAGKSYLIFFLVVIFPGCFCLLGLLLAVVAMTSIEPEEMRVAEAKRKEDEFNQILEALKKREKEEEAATETKDDENKKSEEQKVIEELEKDQRLCSPCWFVFVDHLLKWNCCGCWRWLKQRLHAFVSSPFFDLGIVTCLIINTIFIAMEHYPMSMYFAEHLALANLVFTMIFTVEMVVKVVAMDPYGYFQVGWNVFDSIVVVLSLVELSLMDIYSVPRLFILMRVVRLARWWWSFHMLLNIMWTSVRALRNLTLLLIIMVFIFSLVGMELFGRDYKDHVCRISSDCELPRWHMNSFYYSFLIIARALWGEWVETLWDCMEVSGQATCLIFFIIVVFVGDLLVLHLFLTLLLSSFSYESLAAPEPKEKNNDINRLNTALAWIKTWIMEHARALRGKKNYVNPDHTGRKEYLALNFATDQSVSEDEDFSGKHGNLSGKYHNIESQRAPVADIEIEFKTPENEEEKEKQCDEVQKHPEVQQDKDDEDHKRNTPEDCCSDKCWRCCPFLDIDTSHGAGRVWFNLRRTCFTIVQHKYFEAFMIVIILLSSIALVFEDIHLPNRRVLRNVLEKADQVFTFVFLLEMLLKWVGLGLKRYFTDAWCWFDFLVLDVSLMYLAVGRVGFSDLMVLRSLRALIPLRAVSRFKGMRVVVHTLVRTIPSMINMLLVFLVVWLIFSVAGVQLFAGKMHYCINMTSEELFLPEHVNNKSDCMILIMENYTEVIWKNARLNYDNVMNGYLSLLHVAITTDWMEVLYPAVDATGVESQPIYEYQTFTYLYFICFSIVSSFFTFNLFVRGIIDKLQRDKFGGKCIYMTQQQEKHFKVLKKRLSMTPQKSFPRPENQCQAWLFDLVTSLWYEVFMVVMICLNMVVMMVEEDTQTMEKEEVLYWTHFIFLLIFSIEFFLKIIALRKHYFSSCLNIIDFVVIIVCIVGIFISDFLAKYFLVSFLFPVLRLARISRVLHIIPYTKGIRRLLLAFMLSLPAIFNIALLLFLIVFALSIFGMFNFAYVKKEAMINDMFNFETFGGSMICVVSSVFSPNVNTPPFCDPFVEHPGTTARGDCGNLLAAIVFDIVYIILFFLLMIHMYIAVLLETFSSKDTGPLCDEDLQMFYQTWRQFDPDASQVIQYSKLSDFCDTLQDPLRIPKPNTIKLVHMDLPLLPGDKIHYSDVLLALATQVSGDSGDRDALKARMDKKFMANSSKVSNEPISSTLRRKQEEVAAAVIQRAYRKRLLQQRGAGEETCGASE